MLNTLDEINCEFNKSMDKVVAFINFIDMIKKNSDLYIKENSNFMTVIDKLHETTTVQYNAIIISIYGAYELAIKNSTNQFIKFCINNNLGLSENLVKNYLSSVSKNFERNTRDDNLELIEGLYRFFIQNDITKFRDDLSLNATQNLKISVVEKIANLINISNFTNNAKSNIEFKKYVMTNEGLTNLKEATKYINQLQKPFQFLDDIVDSRNRIAHRGFEANMFDNDTLKKSIIGFRIFIKIYVDSIKSLYGEILFKERKSNLHELHIIKICKNRIICFNTKEFLIDKKTHLLIKTKEDFVIANICCIESNNNQINRSSKNQNIGCELDAVCKKNYDYYIIAD